MNYKSITYVLAWVLEFLAVFMLMPLLVALIYKEDEWVYFLIPIAISFAAGLILHHSYAKDVTKLFAKDGFVAVALSWIVITLIGAIPFRISGSIPHYIDAVFETMSGFTTTGASILTDVEVLPRCMLFWRSLTHWFGGMGFLVFMIAILPIKNASNMYLMKAESPGPVVDKLVPKVKSTAKILYQIYFAMTAALVVVLILLGVPVFDAFCLSFGTAGTGGFGVLNSSIASYGSAVHIVLGIGMVAFGVNFNLYYLILIKRAGDIFKSEELRTYLGIIVASVIAITINIHSMYDGWLLAGKDAFVQVVSIMTTTGFSSADFSLWPSFSQTILVLLMFCGACASSTGGGMKVSRMVIAAKLVKKNIIQTIHPKSVRTIKMDGRVIPDEVRMSISAYFIAYAMLFVASMLIISLDNFDLITTFTSVSATINNIGPGLGVCGPTGNFAEFSYLSKVVIIIDMLVGRLEVIPLLVLFAPRSWRR